MIKRIALIVSLGVFLIGGAFGLFFWLMTAHFNPAPPAYDTVKPRNALEAQRQDVAYFRKLVALDRSYSPAARAEAARRIDALEAAPAPLEHQKFRVALMEIAALADNGHTGMHSDPGAIPLMLPVRLGVFSDGFYVLRAKDAYADTLGARVFAVDGKLTEAVIARLAEVRGGAANFRRTDAVLYITVQDVLYGAGISPNPKSSTWTFITPTGQTLTRTLVAYQPRDDEPFELPKRWLSVDPVAKLSAGWMVLQPDKAQPVTLRDFGAFYRRVRLPGSCAMLVQLKSNADQSDQHIAPFLKDAEADMRAHPPCAAIFDMRFNGGGDYTNTYHFANALPGLVAPGGPIYVLTSPNTFSAAITTTAFVKQAGGARVTILGEPVGDRLAFFSEGNRGCLPNYHLCMNYQTGKHDYTRPCSDWDTCYWLNWFYPVRVKSLDPDETITMSFADWRAGRDPVFDRALALANRVSRPSAR